MVNQRQKRGRGTSKDQTDERRLSARKLGLKVKNNIYDPANNYKPTNSDHPGWKHAHIIKKSDRYRVRCERCGLITKSGGITWIPGHLITKCENSTLEIKEEMQNYCKKSVEIVTNEELKERDTEIFSLTKETELRENKIQELNIKVKELEINQHDLDLIVKGSLQELRMACISTKNEVITRQETFLEEFSSLGVKLKKLATDAENYPIILAENRKMYNEVQDLKGSIRVYCRIRPFRGQTTVESIGENGEIVIANPLQQGNDGRRSFKFNKIFAPTSTQDEVYLDIKPLIRSVLDGYKVCMFAYGPTGSGKTYTMSGLEVSSQEYSGVNYRALNDLFRIADNRKEECIYQIEIQMLEIYNEQVRDLLLSVDGSQRGLRILSTTQPNGLAVPDATTHHVKSTLEVIELMKTGLMNRAVGATALNERSSRSHSVLMVHVCGSDAKTGSIMHGNLHLIDLAGSERVERSKACGQTLKEAQHINKSLSALADVIYALSRKNPHVPYRNSKLTQILHSSLGGQAKTLMFVHLNPDVESYYETISTLKFAERVSGVELGAARSNKEGRDIGEIMEESNTKSSYGGVPNIMEGVKLLRIRDDDCIKHCRTENGESSSSNAEFNKFHEAAKPIEDSEKPTGSVSKASPKHALPRYGLSMPRTPFGARSSSKKQAPTTSKKWL